MRTFHLENLGNTIAKYRNQSNLTQNQLAEMVGVSVPFLSNVERGIKYPRLETLCTISKALHVSIDALLCDDSPDTHLTTINQLLSDKPLRYLIGIEDLIRACNKNFFEDEDMLCETGEFLKSDETGRDQE